MTSRFRSLLLVYVFLLSGCDHTSCFPVCNLLVFPPPVVNESPGGIWLGIDSDGGQIVAFVTETGRFHFFDDFGNQGSRILSVSNGNDVTANFQLVTFLGFTFPDGTTLADCTLSGTVTERQTLPWRIDIRPLWLV